MSHVTLFSNIKLAFLLSGIISYTEYLFLLSILTSKFPSAGACERIYVANCGLNAQNAQMKRNE
jgi:hypothetical protein